MVKLVTTPFGPAAPDTTGTAAARRARYGSLPARPSPAEIVEETSTDPPEDPQMGRDSDRDWMLRYS